MPLIDIHHVMSRGGTLCLEGAHACVTMAMMIINNNNVYWGNSASLSLGHIDRVSHAVFKKY